MYILQDKRKCLVKRRKSIKKNKSTSRFCMLWSFKHPTWYSFSHCKNISIRNLKHVMISKKKQFIKTWLSKSRKDKYLITNNYCPRTEAFTEIVTTVHYIKESGR